MKLLLTAGVTGKFAWIMERGSGLIIQANLPVDSVVIEARSDSVTMGSTGHRAPRPLIKVRVTRLDQPLIIMSICPDNMMLEAFSGIFALTGC